MQPKTYLGRAYEPFYLCRKGTPAIIKEGRLNVFDFPTVPGTKKYHPTERPVALIQEILDTLSVPRSVVLVPFLGSGATLRAAYNLGMTGMGFDINPEYKARFMLAIEEDSRALNGSNSEGELEGLEDFEADEEDGV
jgi:site-specific DNA-methyltransferase (adenine-specific)